jgi:hypothetical protein
MSNILKSPSNLEKIATNPLTQSGLALIATINPLAALLPPLATTLASKRQQLRVDEAFASISTILSKLGRNIESISDNQYKLINDIVVTLLHTVDSEKISVLKDALQNALQNQEIENFDTYFLSRLLRDISAQEVKFLVKSFRYQKIVLGPNSEEQVEARLNLTIDSEDGRLVSGLISLGILASAVGGTYEDLGAYTFTPITAKLLTLLKRSD